MRCGRSQAEALLALPSLPCSAPWVRLQVALNISSERVWVATFGSPRVGNSVFAAFFGRALPWERARHPRPRPRGAPAAAHAAGGDAWRPPRRPGGAPHAPAEDCCTVSTVYCQALQCDLTVMLSAFMGAHLSSGSRRQRAKQPRVVHCQGQVLACSMRGPAQCKPPVRVSVRCSLVPFPLVALQLWYHRVSPFSSREVYQVLR